MERVLRLCSVKQRAEAQGEFRGILNRQNEMPETQKSLFPIYCRLPKLDVAGSIPVSRSIFSIAYGISLMPEHRLNTIKKLDGYKVLKRLGLLHSS